MHDVLVRISFRCSESVDFQDIGFFVLLLIIVLQAISSHGHYVDFDLAAVDFSSGNSRIVVSARMLFFLIKILVFFARTLISLVEIVLAATIAR